MGRQNHRMLPDREVRAAQPRSLQVSEVMPPWKPLFFCVFMHWVGFSGNI
jgi:hypothetical protein